MDTTVSLNGKGSGFYKTLFRLMIPISLQLLVTFGIAFSDTTMIGNVSDEAMAGAYMGSQVQIFLQTLAMGITGTVMILCAQYWGKGDTNSIRILCAIALRILLVISTVLWLVCFFFPAQMLSIFTTDPTVISEGTDFIRILSFSYVFFAFSQVMISTVQSVESVKVGFYISIMAFVVNLLLNWVFVFGNLGAPKLGAAGSALSTLICRICEAAAAGYYVLHKDKKLGIKLSSFFKTDKVLRRDFIKYGAPVLAGQLVWAVNLASQNAIMGRFDAEVITALAVVNMLAQLTFIWMSGLAQGLTIMTSKLVGAGQCETLKSNVKRAQVFFLCIGTATGLFIFLFKDVFISLYPTLSPEAVETARQFMAALAVLTVGTFYHAPLLLGFVRAGGSVSFVFINDSIFVFGVILPAALIAMYVFHAPAWVVYTCLKADQVLKCFVAIVVLNRLKWIKDLTRNRPPQETGLEEAGV